MGYLPHRGWLWALSQVLPHRISPAPKPSREGASFHQRHSFQGFLAQRLTDIASKLQTDHARGLATHPEFFPLPLAAWSEQKSSARRPALQRSNPQIEFAS